MEDRRLRVGSFFEWIAAAAGVAALIWVLSVPVQRFLGPRVEAARVDAPVQVPPGIPVGASNIPVMYFLDGREIRHGELQSRLLRLLPETLLNGPVVRVEGEYGERQTRAYAIDGTRFFIVCERVEAGGPMRVTAIYLP